MKGLLIAAGLVVASVLLVNGQNKYPIELLPGKTMKVSSGEDTLWVIDNDQMQEYMNNILLLKKADSLFNIFQAEVRTLEGVIRKKNETIMTLNKQRQEATTKLKECEATLEEDPKQRKKKKK